MQLKYQAILQETGELCSTRKDDRRRILLMEFDEHEVLESAFGFQPKRFDGGRLVFQRRVHCLYSVGLFAVPTLPMAYMGQLISNMLTILDTFYSGTFLDEFCPLLVYQYQSHE